MPKMKKQELFEEFYCPRCARLLPRNQIYLTMRYEKNGVPVGICIQCKSRQISRIEPSPF